RPLGQPARPLLLEQHLALGLELGIVGERLKRQILGHLDAVLDAVDGGRRGIDEALDLGSLGGAHQRREGVEIDRPGEIGIELERRVVGDAGEMDDGVAALQRLLDHLGVADVALDLAQRGTARALQDVLAVHVEVQHGHLVAGRDELGHEHRADIACAAGHQHAVEVGVLLVSTHGSANAWVLRARNDLLATHFKSVDRYFRISGLVIWWRWPTIRTFIAPTALPMKAARYGSLPAASNGLARAKKASPAPIGSMGSPVSAGVRFTPRARVQ